MKNFLKIITAKDLIHAEKKYFQKENIKEEKLMIQAATQIANYVLNLKHIKKVALLVGKGNNGADAYVTGILLLKQKIEVTAYQLYPYSETSELNKKKNDEFKKLGGSSKLIKTLSKLDITEQLIIDGIFGIGFTNDSVKKNNFIADIIKKINALNIFTISIDVPSGLDANTGIILDQAIKANITISFSLPKLGFFINDGPNFVGTLVNVDIGIKKQYLEEIKTTYYLPNEDLIKTFLPQIKNNRHKYNMSVVGIAGSKKYIGAAKLSCLSALRSGAGIVKLFSPKKDIHLDNFPYEIIKQEITKNNTKELINNCQSSSSIFIGPGLGAPTPLLKKTINSILLKTKDIPIVIDADGLNYFTCLNNKPILNEKNHINSS